MLLNRLPHKVKQANFISDASFKNFTTHHLAGLLLLLTSFILVPVQSARAQVDDDGMLGYSDILAAGLKIHFNDYLRNVAQSFEGKDRDPQQFRIWPEFLRQTDSEKLNVVLSDGYDVRIAETWGFLDYQIAYAQVRGTPTRAQKQRLLENAVIDQIIDQSIDIYWQGLIATRYQEELLFQQARISRLLRDSRLSNVTNALLPKEERQLLSISNEIITRLRFFQSSRNRMYQFIGQRQDFKMRAMPIGVPVNYYDGNQLDQASFRSFVPFATADKDAEIFKDESEAYTEIQRLFPSVQFAIFTGGNSGRRDIIRWHNYSAQLGWNLSNVYKTYPLLRTGINREHARSSAMALVARNRIALIEYRQNLNNFEKALINYNNALWAQANSSVYTADAIESIASDVQKVLTAIDSSSAFAKLQQSYYRLLLGGGYVQVDNIDPRIQERSLANLLETAVERLLITDSLSLGSRIDRGVLAEYADNPDIIRILQAWQQTLVLILASNNGVEKVQADEVLPYLQDNLQQLKDDSMTGDLVEIVNELPDYTKIDQADTGNGNLQIQSKLLAEIEARKQAEIEARKQAELDAEQQATRQAQNEELLTAIAGISLALEKTSQSADLALEAAGKASQAAEDAAQAAEGASEAAVRATEAADSVTEQANQTQLQQGNRAISSPKRLLPIDPNRASEGKNEPEFEFGNFD